MALTKWKKTIIACEKEHQTSSQYEYMLRRLLIKVNKVTAYWRHGNKIPDRALAELSDRQIEYEEILRIVDKIRGENSVMPDEGK